MSYLYIFAPFVGLLSIFKFLWCGKSMDLFYGLDFTPSHKVHSHFLTHPPCPLLYSQFQVNAHFRKIRIPPACEGEHVYRS